jgi:hypothetical protein
MYTQLDENITWYCKVMKDIIWGRAIIFLLDSVRFPFLGDDAWRDWWWRHRITFNDGWTLLDAPIFFMRLSCFKSSKDTYQLEWSKKRGLHNVIRQILTWNVEYAHASWYRFRMQPELGSQWQSWPRILIAFDVIWDEFHYINSAELEPVLTVIFYTYLKVHDVRLWKTDCHQQIRYH